MSMIFQLRMIGTEDEEFLRDYELPYTMSLLDVHHYICADLGYDPMSMSSFFVSNQRWEQEQEFTLMDMGGGAVDGMPLPMESVTLGQLLRRNNDRLIYVFDPFSGRGLFIELMGTLKRQDGIEYPRTTVSNGEAPGQFELLPETGNGGDSIFDDAMDDFYDFGGDDFLDDDF